MKYVDVFKEENDWLLERYELIMERIEDIGEEHILPTEYGDYFRFVSKFIIKIKKVYDLSSNNKIRSMKIEELQELNKELYIDILKENYHVSYANPEFAVEKLGQEFGQVLAFLYTEIRSMIPSAFERRLFNITVLSELFVEIYNLFEEEETRKISNVKEALYWHISDYSQNYMEERVREQLDTKFDFAVDIIRNEDLNQIHYLYYFGEYISENEIKMAQYLNSRSYEEIQDMASTITNGYGKGFELNGKDLSKKKTTAIRYYLGFERLVKEVMKQLKEKYNLDTIIYRYAVNSIHKKQNIKIGYYGTSPNNQYDYDHRFDNGLYMDKRFNEQRLKSVRTIYETYKIEAKHYAGPIAIEVFGEMPFEPVHKLENIHLTSGQQKLSVNYMNLSSQIGNEYMKREEMSFTIIAYPIPEIGEQFEEIFQETIQVNNLDRDKYYKIQQTIIDTLDKGKYVLIKGKGSNETNLKIMLHTLEDSSKQTNFENCTADVNIPVGEVFTSPILTGTEGILHVSEIYLNDLKYKDLRLTFKDGCIIDYSCKNFQNHQDNKKFIKENLMYNHDTLPIGEFAIGTNTTAYVMARKYNILNKMPILIVEKMGPHFAVGDTCYSWSEDNVVLNPNGKEVIAKENEISALRTTDIEKAYFNCHTDITIPYDEIESIDVVEEDGTIHTIIHDSRFSLVGIHELNNIFCKI